MKRASMMWAAVLACGVLAGTVRAADLGDPAAGLQIKSWVKGEAVELKGAKSDNIHVVEFWATWCAPCRASIPHLTELQAKYKDKHVIFIGVSDETMDKVEPFVKSMGDKMDYRVAIDQDRKTNESYMKAYGQNGIPTAYIVNKDGAVVWVGHPMNGLDEALEQVVDGKYDLAKAKAGFAKEQAAMAKMVKANEHMNEYFDLVKGEKKSKNAAKLAKKIFKMAGESPMIMNEFAWKILTDEGVKHRDLKTALKAAKLAYDGTNGNEAAIIDTYARALFDTGDHAGALREQRRAVELCKEPRMKHELEQTLKDYEEKADKDA